MKLTSWNCPLNFARHCNHKRTKGPHQIGSALQTSCHQGNRDSCPRLLAAGAVGSSPCLAALQPQLLHSTTITLRNTARQKHRSSRPKGYHRPYMPTWGHLPSDCGLCEVAALFGCATAVSRSSTSGRWLPQLQRETMAIDVFVEWSQQRADSNEDSNYNLLCSRSFAP